MKVIDRILVVGLLMAPIFGAAFFLVARVTIRNVSAVPLLDLSLSGRGFSRGMRELPPSAEHTFRFVADNDTDLLLAFRVEGNLVETGHLGYYSAPPRPQVAGTITVDPSFHATFAFRKGIWTAP